MKVTSFLVVMGMLCSVVTVRAQEHVSTYRITIEMKAGASDTLTKNNYALYPSFELKNKRCSRPTENTYYGLATDLRKDLKIDETAFLTIDAPAAALSHFDFALNMIERNFLGDWHMPPMGYPRHAHIFTPLVILADHGIQLFQWIAVRQHENVLSKVIALDPNDPSEKEFAGGQGLEVRVSVAPAQRVNLAGVDLARAEGDLAFRLDSYRAKLRSNYAYYKGVPGSYGTGKKDFETYKQMQNDLLNFVAIAGAKGDSARADAALGSLCLSGIKR